MKWLSFAPATSCGRKRVALARFEDRSSLPVSAACVVAGGVRERLSALLHVPVAIRLFEPVIPSPQAWQAIAGGAHLYRVRGGAADAAIVLRPDDARALARAAFGEEADRPGARALSPIERNVLDRAIGAITGALAPVCGSLETPVPERIESIAGFVTYFELSLEMPVASNIGVALSREPESRPQPGLDARDLGDVELTAIAALEVGAFEAGAMANLVPGAILPITRSNALRGSLRIGGRTLAHGACGAYRGRYALEIEG